MRNAETPFGVGTAGKTLALAVPSGNAEAWKKLIGGKPVSARLETLPESHVRMGALLTSVVFQSAVAVLLVLIPVIFPSSLQPFIDYEVTQVTTLETRVLLPTEKQPAPHPESMSAPTSPAISPEPARLSRKIQFAPMVVRRSASDVVQQPDAPVIAQSFGGLALEDSREPVRPRDPVKTGVMAEGISMPANVAPPAVNTRLQTGLFGETRNQPDKSGPESRSQAVRVGALEVPEAAASEKSRGAAGSMKGAVAGAGFGNAILTSTASNPAHEEVKSSSFAAVTISPETERPKNIEPVLSAVAVVILEKPNPVYSDEARRLGIEGDVQIRAVFLASGSVNIVGVSQGLGHGLDEAALQAARRIRFKPAQRDGKAVDFPATIRIVFQLAF
jgi:protein TonB